SPEAAARVVLGRIRQLLDAYMPNMPVERPRLPDVLAAVLNDPILERERLFSLGWLHWLNDEPAAAESFLAEATRRAREQNATEALAESAYWCARVRLLLGRSEALAEFESVLRTLGGSPRATAWFVDLLGRAGRVDRAEQVWKSVRGNRRVAGCVEGPLLEARMLLRRGERATAERLLSETMPTNGVVWVEQRLLLAWIAASQKQQEKARDLLRQACEGPYPAAALQTWTARVEQRLGSEPAGDEGAEHAPAALRDFLNGQRARRQGRTEEAIVAYRAALGSPMAQPFARYGLACLGQEDFAALLASQPGLFLAVRSRARLAVERFRRRAATAAECLDALQQAAVNGYRDAAAEHFRRLAAVLQQRQPDAAVVGELAANPNTDAAARNAFRAALELAVRCLSPIEARAVLLEWAKREDLNEELRRLVGRQLLRLLLLTETDEETSATVERLLAGEPLLTLTHNSHNQPGARATGASHPSLALRAGSDSPAAHLWQAAHHLDPQSAETLRELRSLSRWKGLAQALFLQEAAQRGDTAAVLALLDEADAWRGLHAPPRFVLRALESAVAAQPNNPGWRLSLSRWLQLWDPASLGAEGATLAIHAGLTLLRGDTAEPPLGVPAVPWLLHQAARALGRDDAIEALAFTRRALVRDPELPSVPDARVVREALPELERRARAQSLAAAVQPNDEVGRPAAGVLVDAVEALADLPDGAAVLDALASGDRETGRARLDALSERPDLAPRLAHHLALLMQRAARCLEEREETTSAEPYWRQAWSCWLRFLGTMTDAGAQRIVLDFLLEQHRHRLNDLLARDAVDAARRHWNLMDNLAARAGQVEESFGREVAERIERFREELANEYLGTTREAMRYGSIPEGWRADYEKGLGYLRRLLSLDRENARLLAALVEICNDWFLDLYHLNDAAGLRMRVERFTPFALQLARRIDERPGDLSARAALSDFWKFRGFVAADRAHKAALYREALRFNPVNTNVRDLLAELEATPQ
ncbi:MAG TPA: hypothetical protein VH575_30000, partial [Gemmataceae bacterium]